MCKTYVAALGTFLDIESLILRFGFCFTFGTVLGQHFGHNSALDERSQVISDMSLHRISPCIFLDGSDLGLELWRGHFLLPSWEKGCQVGRVGNRPEQ